MAAPERVGWRPELDAGLGRQGGSLEPMRVVLSERGAFRVSDGEEELAAVLPGRLRHRAAARDLPVVGDWVAIRRAAAGPRIESVLPRSSVLARRDPDQKSEQVLVANVDVALVLMGLDGDFNVRRLERYLTLVAAAGVAPVIVLSKADLCPDVSARLAEIAAVAPGVPLEAVDLTSASGPSRVRAHVAPRRTAVLLGSSGVGKSTMLNAFLGADVQETQGVREHDSRGRHTTTRRQLFVLPGGELVIDMPGLRELDPWQASAGLGDSFADVVAVAGRCRFRDCRHAEEPDCAVLAAVAAGELAPERVAAYRKLKAEQTGR